ncbi:histidine kinase [Chitinophaga skermanii]|uniref:Histidine kinase n=1 Tax=Chitinophaga skermanii TaxID=331697 RepID=A0A327QZ05_9BACT|nr:histidine kinase [Chitinophaga skermanii]RAJ08862.1 histidine kinase [Chitinophaga skermanii]
MQKNRETFLNNTGKRVVFTVSACFLLYLVSFILDPFSKFWPAYFDRPRLEIMGEWMVSLVLCYSISESSIFISNKLNKYIPWMEHPARRLAVESLLCLVSTLFIHFMIGLFFTTVLGEEGGLFGSNLDERKWIIQWIVISFLIALMIAAINSGNYLINNWKNEALRANQLNQVVMEIELQALKLQIDPHFVFNNLSVLSELILRDQQLGYDYAENFSKIYRYMLINAKKDLIYLEDELKFLQSYIFLIKQRVGDGVEFAIEVDKEAKHFFMPPLTLQLLVENALKHNKTTKSNPLRIKIYNNDKEELIVENALLPIEKPIQSSGIGIKNITKRFVLLAAKQPVIVKDESTFKVIIPLIRYDQ